MNQNSKHTAGPWHYDATWSLITGPHNKEICAVHAAATAGERRVNRSEAQANAALIASAPALLRQRDELASALRALTVQASIAGNHCLAERGFSDFHEAIKNASAALASIESEASK